MWIFLNNAFLSIVDPRAAYGGGKGPVSAYLLVRARFKGDLERVFGKAIRDHVEETPDRDYRFRASVKRQLVADVISKALAGIDYANFKGSTREGWRHDAYLGCWTVMEREQRRRAQATARGHVELGRQVTDRFVDNELFEHPHAPAGPQDRRRPANIDALLGDPQRAARAGDEIYEAGREVTLTRDELLKLKSNHM